MGICVEFIGESLCRTAERIQEDQDGRKQCLEGRIAKRKARGRVSSREDSMDSEGAIGEVKWPTKRGSPKLSGAKENSFQRS